MLTQLDTCPGTTAEGGCNRDTPLSQGAVLCADCNVAEIEAGRDAPTLEREWEILRARVKKAAQGWGNPPPGRDAFNSGVWDGSARAFQSMLMWMDETRRDDRKSDDRTASTVPTATPVGQ